jgi:sodium-dependent dicarboxylate transporter 2/3/5
MRISKDTFLIIGPIAACLTTLLALSMGLDRDPAIVGGITVLCAIWWIFEPISIPATSLIPFAAFPLFGILSHQEVAKSYGHTLILLLLGGFMLSTAMERSGSHRRLAMAMVRLFGGKGAKGLVLGFMVATAVLSMWISNTATVLMLLPVALAILEDNSDENLTLALLLGIAYAASIGGLGTPIGTPPNVIFMGVYKEMTGQSMSFLSWMSFGIPTVILFIPIAWMLLCRKVSSNPSSFKLPQSGPWRKAEVRVLLVFFFAALAWTTRTAPFGGWSSYFGVPEAGDSTVALVAVVLMFIIPDGTRSPDGSRERLLDWDTARNIPWGLLLLFGGGLAIAKAFQVSGLSQNLGEQLSQITSWNPVLMILVICLSVTFLTEITSNTASATLLMPILAATALSAQLDPKLLMIPAALSASCAFMLPVATAPNAIVFGTYKIPIRRMAREGILLNIFGALIITIMCAALL